MGGDAAGVSGLSATAPVWDRYGGFPQLKARLALVLLAMCLVFAAWAPGMAPPPAEVPQIAPPVKDVAHGSAPPVTVSFEDDGKDNDLRFYRLVIERVKRGDDYYVTAVQLQRANGYPVAPALTVRLPTLALASAMLGTTGIAITAILLLAAIFISNYRRFDAEPGGENFRLFGLALLFVGLSTAINPKFAVLHEVWAAQLMALSFGLHRPVAAGEPGGKWIGAWLAAAAALSIRELALPFVLLMAAYALWRRSWREGAAWTGLIVLFTIGMTIHLYFAAAQIIPGDPVSPPWLVLGGISAFLHKVIYSSSLNLLPIPLAGPAVILALFGWTGWKSQAGTFASLLTFGYAFAFMIAGRANNFYWGVVILPILFMGLAMVPMAMKSLWKNAAGLRSVRGGARV